MVSSPRLRSKTIKVLSLRVKKTVSLEPSVMFTIELPEKDVDSENIKWIGWEPNNDGKFLPRCASLASSMDPQRLVRKYCHIKSIRIHIFFNHNHLPTDWPKLECISI